MYRLWQGYCIGFVFPHAVNLEAECCTERWQSSTCCSHGCRMQSHDCQQANALGAGSRVAITISVALLSLSFYLVLFFNSFLISFFFLFFVNFRDFFLSKWDWRFIATGKHCKISILFLFLLTHSLSLLIIAIAANRYQKTNQSQHRFSPDAEVISKRLTDHPEPHHHHHACIYVSDTASGAEVRFFLYL